MTPKLYTLYVFQDDVRVSYGTVPSDWDCDQLITEANEWAGENNWNRLELGPEKSFTKFGEEA